MTHEFWTVAGVVVVAWAALAATYAAEHAYLRHLREWKRYVIGLLPLIIGCFIIGAIFNNPLLAVVPAALSTAGIVVIVAYLNEDPNEAQARAQGKRASISRLSQHWEKERRESGMDEASRQN